MRYPLIALLTVLAYLLGHFTGPATKNVTMVKIEGVAWCFVKEYPDLTTYGQADPLPTVLIDVVGKRVRVYTECGDK
jgi:hypothetical protein